jgi:predicted permease
MATLLNDLRYGFRMLRTSRSLTAVAVLSLALGIGANTAIFSLVDKLLVRSLPVVAPDQLVLLSAESVNPRFLNTVFSYPDYAEYRDRNQAFSGLIAFRQTQVRLGKDNQPERLKIELVSGNYFDALGVRAARGRMIQVEDDKTPGAHPVAVLSYDYWQRRFGSDSGVIGQTITLNGASYSIIGVARQGYQGIRLERPADAWVPLMMVEQLMKNSWLKERTSGWLELVGRLKAEVTMAQAEQGMDTLARQVRETHFSPAELKLPFNEKRMLLASGSKGKSLLRDNLSKPLTLLMAAVGVILLIACANVANLLLSRAAARRKEIAIRLALGASRGRIISQLLAESVLLALTGGAAGLLLAPWLTELLLAFQARVLTTPTTLNQTLDGRVLAFTLVISVLSGIVFGLAPALESSRADLLPALKEEGAIFSHRERRFSTRHLLVVAQVALSLVVLIGAGLFIRSLHKLWAIDLGFKPEGVLLLPMELPEQGYDEARGREFYRQLLARTRSLPGVVAVSLARVVPFEGGVMSRGVMIEGYQDSTGKNIGIDANDVGPGYHELMGIQILKGRGFNEQDHEHAPGVAIINEAMARLYFPNQNPLGKSLRVGPGNPPLEIIGVARDSKFHDVKEAPLPHFDLPVLQRGNFSFMTLQVRATGDAASLWPALRREALSLEPGMRISAMSTLDEEISQSIAPARMATTLTSLLGLSALLLAAIGLYGVMAYGVNRRRREIGIRLALGAQTRDVLRLVVGQGLKLVLVGVAIGLIAAWALTRLMAHLLFEVSATDPLTFAAVAWVLIAVALVACYLPARRASKVDPMTTLRCE